MATPTYTLIDSVTLASSAASVTFSGISGTGKGDLVLVINANGSTATSAGIRFNADSGSNYSYVDMKGSGSSGSSQSFTNSWISIFVGGFGGYTEVPLGTVSIADFAATDKHKSVLFRGGNTERGFVEASAQRWANTAAITAIEVFVFAGTYDVGSTFHLYQLVSE